MSNAIKERVAKVGVQFSKTRAMRIARTETATASNEGSRAAAKAMNVPGLKKEWVSALDSGTRDQDDSANHRRMNGVRVDMEEKFLVPSNDGPDEMEGPGDPNAPVDQIVNCRCTLVYTDESKSINLRSSAERRRFLLNNIRKRNQFEKRMAKDLSKHFKSESERLQDALSDVQDVKDAEVIAMQVLDETEAGIKQTLDGRLSEILESFGQDVLKDFRGT